MMNGRSKRASKTQANTQAKSKQTAKQTPKQTVVSGSGTSLSVDGGSGGKTRAAAWEAVLEDPEFADLRSNLPWRKAWDEWVEHARDRSTKAKAPPRARARRIFRDALEDPAKHAEAIRASIRNDWQGINPAWIREGPSGARKSNADQAIEELNELRRNGLPGLPSYGGGA